jgi:ribonuclease P protein component
MRPACQNGAPRANQQLGRDRRLTSPVCFQEAYAQERKGVGRFMVMYLREGEDASLRLGVVSSRKVGGAVDRVRARRRLREVWRTHRAYFHGEVDVVLVARRTLLTARWPEVVKDLLDLAQRAGLTRGALPS